MKTSLAPGSQVVAEYLANSGLQKDLDKLGFNLVGFGCTTCIGNSGPLPEEISKSINDNGIVAAAVLSGNRNFEGRVSPDVQANYLASPPLVVAYALAGTVTKDLDDRAARHRQGRQAGLPARHLADQRRRSTTFIEEYRDHEDLQEPLRRRVQGRRQVAQDQGAARARPIAGTSSSTYVQNPPYFEGMTKEPEPVDDIVDARILALFGDKITTDHISPAGSIKADLAGRQISCCEHQVSQAEFQPVRHAARQP